MGNTNTSSNVLTVEKATKDSFVTNKRTTRKLIHAYEPTWSKVKEVLSEIPKDLDSFDELIKALDHEVIYFQLGFIFLRSTKLFFYFKCLQFQFEVIFPNLQKIA